MFRLQQFSVKQDQCAMKVCTDSLVFGAMAPIEPTDTVLDIGAGTGLLSLMAKQQGASEVIAIEIIESAALQAQDNVANSPWPEDIDVRCADICTYQTEQRFDVVIANPPFFDQHLKSDQSHRNIARHTDTLSYQSLITRANELLAPMGTIYLLLPLHVRDLIVQISNGLSLHLIKQTDYITKQGGSAKLAAFHFGRSPVVSPKHEQLTIYASHQQYTNQSSHILKDYLLRFANV